METITHRSKAQRSKIQSTADLKDLSMSELQTTLASSPDGLTQVEASKRLTQYGPNEIKEEKTNPYLKFLSYFWGPIPWMIEVAVILSGVVKHWPDFFIILLLLVSNAVVGFWEEHEAGNAIAALKAKLSVKARVKRDGKWITPASRELVPGDVIRLRLGDIVPADAPPAGGRSGGGRSIGPNRRVVACRTQIWRGGVFWFNPSSGGNWCTGPMLQVQIPTLARRRNWCRRCTPSAIFKKRF